MEFELGLKGPFWVEISSNESSIVVAVAVFQLHEDFFQGMSDTMLSF